MKKINHKIASQVLTSLVMSAFLFMPGHSSHASPTQDYMEDDEIFIDDSKAMHSSEMEEARGGFIDPSGLIYRFAVDVRSQVDGIVSYRRSLVVEPSAGGQLQATSSVQIQEAPSLPPGTIANIIENGKGVVVDSQNGKTTILNQTQSGAFANVIMNTADNRVISQKLDINVMLKSLPQILDRYGVSAGRSTLMQSISARTLRIGR